MEANVNAQRMNEVVAGSVEMSEATRAARYAVLSEAPGLVFALITLAWIVTSLCGLA